jgi:glycerol-3-phosphate dehydrogenase (NAD(P)+)
VASIAVHNHPTVLWARSAEVAGAINERHESPDYLPGFGLPKRLGATADMEEAVADADLIIVGVPTAGFRGTLEAAAPFIRPWVPVVSLAKGLEQGTLLRMTEIIREVLPGHPAAALTGPNIASEIMAGYAAASVIATDDLDVAQAIQRILSRHVFRIYINDDVLGCELCGAFKNVVAIAAGMGQGIGVGDNTRAAVMTRGLAEITRLGVTMGAKPATFGGLAGMGDLIATCMSPHSRNRSVGEQLGRGRPLEEILAGMNMVAEGVKTASLVLQLGEQHGIDLPVCWEINRVISGEATINEAYRGLTPPQHEAQPG